MSTFNINLSKLNVRPEVSIEPTNFITLMSNAGKAFSSSDGMACCYQWQCFDQFQFLPGHLQAKVLHFLRP